MGNVIVTYCSKKPLNQKCMHVFVFEQCIVAYEAVDFQATQDDSSDSCDSVPPLSQPAYCLCVTV